jgi:hypothetical protein
MVSGAGFQAAIHALKGACSGRYGSDLRLATILPNRVRMLAGKIPHRPAQPGHSIGTVRPA